MRYKVVEDTSVQPQNGYCYVKPYAPGKCVWLSSIRLLDDNKNVVEDTYEVPIFIATRLIALGACKEVGNFGGDFTGKIRTSYQLDPTKKIKKEVKAKKKNEKGVTEDGKKVKQKNKDTKIKDKKK